MISDAFGSWGCGTHWESLNQKRLPTLVLGKSPLPLYTKEYLNEYKMFENHSGKVYQ